MSTGWLITYSALVSTAASCLLEFVVYPRLRQRKKAKDAANAKS